MMHQKKKFLFHLLFLILLSNSSVNAQTGLKGLLIGTEEYAPDKFRIIKIDSAGKLSYLTNEYEDCRNPVLSPDGMRIVYGVHGDTVVGSNVIKEYKLNKLREFQYIYDIGEYPKPTESGNGFIFTIQRLWIMNIDGSGKRQLTGSWKLSSDDTPRWSQDGEKIIYVSYRPYGISRGRIWEVDLETNKEKEIEIDLGQDSKDGDDFQSPDYSPDERYIVFIRRIAGNQYPDIFIKDLEKERIYCFIKNHPNSFNISVQWSPEGKYIILSTINDIRKINIDRSGMYGPDYQTQNWIKPEKYEYFTFSNDGNKSIVCEKNGDIIRTYIYDKYFQTRQEIKLPPRTYITSWGGFENQKMTSPIRISADEIKYYNKYLVILCLFLVSIVITLISALLSYSNKPVFLSILIGFSGILFIPVTFPKLYIVWTAIYIPIIFGIIIIGNRTGRLFQRDIISARKDLLTALLEFGHSGSVTNNIDVIIYDSYNLFKNGSLDSYYRKSLFSDLNDFLTHSRPSIFYLSVLAKKAWFVKTGNRIQSYLKITQKHIKILKENPVNFEDSNVLIQNLTDLRNSIEELETSAYNHFQCNVLVEMKTILNGLKQVIENEKIEPISIYDNGLVNCYAHIDPVDFIFVMNNLIDNAIKAVKETTIKSIGIRLTSDISYVNIRVSDSGIGIPSKKKDFVFHPGKSKLNGHGFGLYRSREILVKYKGNLEIESSIPEKGTTFILKLRVFKPEKKNENESITN